MLAGSLTLSAAASAATPRQPTGKWTLDYAENMCILQRSYRTADDPLLIALKPAPMSDDIQLIVMTEGGGSLVRSGKVKIGFGEASSVVETRFVSASPRGKSTRLMLIDLKRPQIEPLRTTKVLTVQVSNGMNEAFAIDAAPMALRGLDACVKDLLQSWGMDEQTLASITTPPAPLKAVREVFSDTDYPDAAIRNEEEGTVGIRFLVGTDGVVRDCKIVETSGSALLDLLTCRIWTTRARFKPATDKVDKPLPSLSFTRVTWRLP